MNLLSKSLGLAVGAWFTNCVLNPACAVFSPKRTEASSNEQQLPLADGREPSTERPADSNGPGQQPTQGGLADDPRRTASHQRRERQTEERTEGIETQSDPPGAGHYSRGLVRGRWERSENNNRA